MGRSPYSALNELHFSNEARYRQREEYVNHVEMLPPYWALNERYFSNETRYERETRRRKWRGHRGSKIITVDVQEDIDSEKDVKIGHKDYRENFSQRRQTNARREETRQTHTGEPQQFSGRKAVELEDQRTQQVIHKLFRLVEDTRIKSGAQRRQDRSGARPVQFY